MPGEFVPYACPVGVRLWEEYRRHIPEAPPIPPERAEDWPEATAYWAHTSTCDDCNEV